MLLLHRFHYQIKNFLSLATPLEQIIQLPIYNQALFDQAFAHTSGVKGYDRLEFLGDSVLQTVVSEYLYENFPHLKEGKLTEVRSKLVRRTALNLLGYRIGLGKLIQSKFLEFETKTQENQRIFGDTLEALIGAVYLNSGYPGAYFFVIEVLLNRYVKVEELLSATNNYKGELLELAQKKNFSVDYELIENNPKRSKIVLYINEKPQLSASAKNRKKAEQKAAKKYLQSDLLKSKIDKS